MAINTSAKAYENELKNIHKNNKRVDTDYEVGDKLILNNHAAYKYETLSKGPFLITQCWTNGTIILQCGPTELVIIDVILSHIHLIQKLKILTLKNMYGNFNI